MGQIKKGQVLGLVTDLSTLTSGVAANVTAIGVNNADITSLEGSVNSLEAIAVTLGSSITTNGQHIDSLEGSVNSLEAITAANTTAIGVNVTAIGVNDADITSLEGSVNSLEAITASNTTAIGVNNADITSLEGSVNSLEAITAANTTAIGVNVTAIGVNATAIGVNDADITSLEGSVNSLEAITVSLGTAIAGLGHVMAEEALVFSGAGTPNVWATSPQAYDIADVTVFVNGLRVDGTSYTYNAGSDVTFDLAKLGYQLDGTDLVTLVGRI